MSIPKWQVVSSTLTVFFVTLALFWYHAAPSVSFHDSGAFVLAAASGGLVHPPGAPTWTLGATLFLKLGNFADPAYGCNLYAGLWGAITIALLYLLSLLMITRYYPLPKNWQCMVAALLPSAILLHSDAFLEQSLIVEQYTLLTGLMVGLVILLVQPIRPDLPSRKGIFAIAFAIGLVWGLAIGNHMSQICLVVPVAYYLLYWFFKSGRNWKFTTAQGAFVGLGLLVGSSIFLYLFYVNYRQAFFDGIKADSFERFMWAIQRKMWTRREISEAPVGFTGEWFLTYNLIGELSIVGFLLSIAGLGWILRNRWQPAIYMPLIALPYCAGLFYGHLTQSGMDIQYIRYYGVQDWHLPLYITLAFMSLGLVFAIKNHARLVMGVSIVALVLSGTAVANVWANSFRGWTAPERFIEFTKSGLMVENNIFLAQGDDASNMIAYDFYGRNKGSGTDRRMVYSFPAQPPRVKGQMAMDDYMSSYTEILLDAKLQPLRLQKENFISARPDAYYIGYSPNFPSYDNLILSGYVYRVAEKDSVTSDVILQSDKAWRNDNPLALPLPQPDSHRLEKPAYAGLYAQRGYYYDYHGFLQQAIEEYKRSLRWVPDNGHTWASLGVAYEKLDRSKFYQEALIAYESAIQGMPTLPRGYFLLGNLQIDIGNREEGLENLKMALDLDPTNELTKRRMDEVLQH